MDDTNIHDMLPSAEASPASALTEGMRHNTVADMTAKTVRTTNHLPADILTSPVLGFLRLASAVLYFNLLSKNAFY
jgi:hypothetical protein